ncbi:hypothetical protein QN239_10420 [Mycolicibacterium sp. Y3]
MFDHLTPGERRHLGTATHEASHAVIAAVHGGTIDRAEVLRGGPRTTGEAVAGYTRYMPWEAAVKPYVPVITAAGSAGEAVYDNGGKPTLTQVMKLLTAKNVHDLDQMTKMSLAKGRNPLAAVDEVLPLVSRLWPQIAKLSLAMFRTGPIDHRAVLDVLNIPSHAEQHRYAAAIRAGAEPGKLSAGRQLF